jgi:hypothetical protein
MRISLLKERNFPFANRNTRKIRDAGVWLVVILVAAATCADAGLRVRKVNSVSSDPIAKSTAVLQGTVADVNAAFLPAVIVSAANLDSGISRSVMTDDTGFYQFISLPVGSYRITAQLRGFQTQLIEKFWWRSAARRF